MTRNVHGLDLVGFRPDYSKSAEENLKAYREAYRRVYGEYPPTPNQGGGEGGKVIPLPPRPR